MAYHPGRSGAEVEAIVMARILAASGNVAVPFGNHQPYDLISEFDGVLKRIQIRRAYEQTGRSTRKGEGDCSVRFECDLRRTVGFGMHQIREADAYDFLVVVAASHCYVIPEPLVRGQGSLVLRPPGYDARRRSGRLRSFDPEDYREAWVQLKEG